MLRTVCPQLLRRRDERAQHDHARLQKEARHFRHAPDIFRAIVVAEAEVAIQAAAHIIAVEREGAKALRAQLPLQRIRERALARSRKTVEPDDAARVVSPRPRVEPGKGNPPRRKDAVSAIRQRHCHKRGTAQADFPLMGVRRASVLRRFRLLPAAPRDVSPPWRDRAPPLASAGPTVLPALATALPGRPWLCR